MTSKALDARTHMVIPDLQIRPGVPTDHLNWIGQYIVDRRPDVVVQIGDAADMESLSSYDRGTKSFEGRRYNADIKCANDGFDKLNLPLIKENQRLARNKKSQWWPDRYVTLGNHENRINRAVERSPELDGTISTDDLNYAAHGWQVSPFLEVIDIDGVWYSHYFVMPLSGRALGGTIENRLNKIGHTFTQGHTQILQMGLRFVGGKSQHGLVAGAAYMHHEKYLGPQGNSHWRGIVMKHEVVDGSYDIMTVSLNYLCRRYEGADLDTYLWKKHKIKL